MNMTQEDKELVYAFCVEFVQLPLERIAKIAHRYHIAKMEQAASGFEEWVKGHPFLWTSDSMKDIAREGYQSGAASQQAKIAELTEEVAELQQSLDLLHKADMRAVVMWREKTGKELTIPDHADLCCWLAEEVERLEAAYDQSGRTIQHQGRELQSAQLVAKTYRDVLVDTLDFVERHSNRWDGITGKHPAEIVDSAREALSTPIDTSAADELLTRAEGAEADRDSLRHGYDTVIKDLYEKLGVDGSDGELRYKWASLALSTKLDQLTDARSALMEAREALTSHMAAYSAVWRQGVEILEPIGDAAIAAITRALGEEQKKEE